MAKKMKRIGPFGWFARAFAAGFGAVAGVMFAGAIGSVLFSGVLSTNGLPAFAYGSLTRQPVGVTIHSESPHLVPAPAYATPDAAYSEQRTAHAGAYSYPTTSYPVVTAPTISASEDERPPEPDVEIEVQYR